MLDALVIAPHPDDAELGMGGTIALMLAQGMSVGILDLTDGEPPGDRLRSGPARRPRRRPSSASPGGKISACPTAVSEPACGPADRSLG